MSERHTVTWQFNKKPLVTTWESREEADFHAEYLRDALQQLGHPEMLMAPTVSRLAKVKSNG